MLMDVGLCLCSRCASLSVQTMPRCREDGLGCVRGDIDASEPGHSLGNAAGNPIESGAVDWRVSVKKAFCVAVDTGLFA